MHGFIEIGAPRDIDGDKPNVLFVQTPQELISISIDE